MFVPHSPIPDQQDRVGLLPEDGDMSPCPGQRERERERERERGSSCERERETAPNQNESCLRLTLRVGRLG